MQHPIQGVQAMTVHVTDPARARTFYREVLGLEELQADPALGLYVYAVPGAPPLALHEYSKGCEEAGGRPPGTVTGIIFASDDAYRAVEHIAAHGGRVVAPVEKGPMGTAGVVADPDGNEYLVAQRENP